jgi:hypothetical protein
LTLSSQPPDFFFAMDVLKENHRRVGRPRSDPRAGSARQAPG